jgi:hypothetical protein
MVERQNGHKIKPLRSDSGGEHVSNVLVALCDQEGIVSDMVQPESGFSRL